MRRAVGVALEGDGGHGYDWSLGKPLFQIRVFRLTLSQSQPPTVIVDHDIHMIRIIEGCCAAIKSSVVEVPFGRSDLPDQLREIVPVFVVSGPAAFGGEVKLIP